MSGDEASDERLERQLGFLLEIDRLKGVQRRSYLVDGSRRENSAEHSWHVALMALVLAEYADEDLDPMRAVCMMLLHDVVEIDAGDTFRYDDAGARDQAQRERLAADRLYALLPGEQGRRLRELWQEFEARESPEARFAAAVDRLLPLLQNAATEGRTWREHGVRADQVLAKNAPIADGSKRLWELARRRIRAAVEAGHLAPADPSRTSAEGR